MGDGTLTTSAYAGWLLAVAGVVAWMSGTPFVFPSLGPSAFVLATSEDPPGARRVVGEHLVGVVAGMATYHLIATGLVVTGGGEPFALDQLRLAASAVASVTMTAVGMQATDTVHASACATTLIVSLGLLSDSTEGFVVAAAVVVLFASHAGTERAIRR